MDRKIQQRLDPEQGDPGQQTAQEQTGQPPRFHTGQLRHPSPTDQRAESDVANFGDGGDRPPRRTPQTGQQSQQKEKPDQRRGNQRANQPPHRLPPGKPGEGDHGGQNGPHRQPARGHRRQGAERHRRKPGRRRQQNLRQTVGRRVTRQREGHGHTNRGLLWIVAT
jgi:hypothetical protein